MRKGVTLIETLLGVVVIAIVSFGVYQTYVTLLEIFSATRVKIAAAAIANEEMEVIRNMPYAAIGTVGGVPAGSIPATQARVRDDLTFTLTTTVRNVDDPFDGTIGGNPNDLSPADYKLIELGLSCASCGASESFAFTGRAAPRALETASTNGALFIQVIDANGQFLPDATVQVTNTAVTPVIQITDVTNANGVLQIVDVPPSTQSYEITVSKSGYSTERTYALAPNFNPVRPHATVALQTVTQMTFVIDKVGSIALSGVTPICTSVSDGSATVTGAKLIATNPNVAKYSQTHVMGALGAVTLSQMEWDSYGITFTHPTYNLAGTIPNPPLTLAPNGSQSAKMVLEPAIPSALLVTVLDQNTQLPLSDASVTISRTGYSSVLSTGRGFLRQTDWAGGTGQESIGALDRYSSDDGQVEALLFPGELRLKEATTSSFYLSGELISSTFDTGSPSNFYTVSWQPQAQLPQTGADSVRLQIATATTSNPSLWNFMGPDGTTNTFFTTANGTVNAIHNGDRYIRYRVYLSTNTQNFTPTLSDVAITFSSDCVPPGQVLFQGISNDMYTIDVTRTGYQAVSDGAVVNSSWQEKIIYMNP